MLNDVFKHRHLLFQNHGKLGDNSQLCVYSIILLTIPYLTLIPTNTGNAWLKIHPILNR